MTESNPFLSETYESDRNIIKHSINQYSELISKIHGEDKEEVKKNLLTYFKANKEKYKSTKLKYAAEYLKMVNKANLKSPAVYPAKREGI